MKECPSCRSPLPDNAVACSHCGGSYRPDGGFQTSWDAEMARMAAERERKVSAAEEFGKLGKPHPHFFLENKGCLVSALALLLIAATLVVGLVVLT